MGALFGGPFTGAALNPARAFGPALAANHWTNHGVYWIGPLAGGVAAGWLYDTLFLSRKSSEDRSNGLTLSSNNPMVRLATIDETHGHAFRFFR